MTQGILGTDTIMINWIPRDITDKIKNENKLHPSKSLEEKTKNRPFLNGWETDN